MCNKNAFTTDHGETDQGDSTVQPTTPGLRFFTQGTTGHLRELISAMKRHRADGVRFAIIGNDGDLEVFELRRIDRSIEEVAGEMHKMARAPEKETRVGFMDPPKVEQIPDVGANAAEQETLQRHFQEHIPDVGVDLTGNGEDKTAPSRVVSPEETAFGAQMEELEEVLQYVRDVAAHQQERSYLIRRGKELEAELAGGSLPSIARDLLAH